MLTDTYEQVADIQTAITLLRPGAVWKIKDGSFTEWHDERPCPSMKEVQETIKKINKFKREVKTIWTNEQLAEQKKKEGLSQRILNDRPHNKVGKGGGKSFSHKLK